MSHDFILFYCNTLPIVHRDGYYTLKNNLNVDTGYFEVITLYWTIVISQYKKRSFYVFHFTRILHVKIKLLSQKTTTKSH